MALTQQSLVEEILTRSERAVVRGIYRASQLSETLVLLDKMTATLSDASKDVQHGESQPHINETQTIEHIITLKQYLISSVQSALVNTKVPAPKIIRENPTDKQP